MNFSDSYQAYVEGEIVSGNPLNLVIALYDGTIQAVRRAKDSIVTGDVWGRAKAINKAVELLTELMASLNYEEGGEISANLKRLYSYMQCRLLEAHAQQLVDPMDEVDGLLSTILEGWRGAAEKTFSSAAQQTNNDLNSYATPEELMSGYSFIAEDFTRLAGAVSAVF